MKGNSFTVGIDYKNWGGNAWQDSINGNQNELVNKTVNEVAGYVIMQQNLFDKVSLNAGVRYEHNNIFGGEWIPQAGFTVRPFEGNVIKASLSKGFRSPNIREMYMFPPSEPRFETGAHDELRGIHRTDILGWQLVYGVDRLFYRRARYDFDDDV